MKNSLKAYWQTWSERFAALNQRERLLVAGATVLGGLYLGTVLWVEPMFARAKRYAVQSSSQAAELANLHSQIVALGQQVAQDPNQPLRDELARLNEQIQAAEGHLSAFDASLVPPDKMPALLERLVRKTPGVRLAGFKTLPVEGLLAAKRASATGRNNASPNGEVPPALGADVYKHGFELKVRGNYLALMAYLKTLEAQPDRLLWQRAQLTVDKYPESELTLTVFTLSMDKHWLEL